MKGTHKITARFVSLDDGKVTLEKENGDTVGIQLAKLSEADQKLVAKLAQAADEDPFVPTQGSHPKGPGEASGVEEPGPADAGNWSHVRNVQINLFAHETIVPDAAGGDKLRRPRTIVLRPPQAGDVRKYFFEEFHGMFLDRRRQMLLVASINRDPGKTLGARLEACDLKRSGSVGVEILGTPKPPADLSPDGTCVVCLPHWTMTYANLPKGVEVWKLARGGSLLKRWLADQPENEHDIAQADHAWFVSDSQLLTFNSGKRTLTLWNIADASAVYTIQLDNFQSVPAFSANRKQMAVVENGQICILNPATGETIAVLPEHSGLGGAMAFRPDGAQVAVCSSALLQVWDLAARKLVSEVWFPKTGLGNVDWLDWVDDQHVLVNGSELADLPRQIVLWRYKHPLGGPRMWGGVYDGSLAYVSTRNTGRTPQTAVAFLALPSPEALQAAESLKLDELLALQPGSQVRLDLQGAVGGDDLQKLTASIEAQLKTKGMSVAANAPISLKASVETGKTETLTFHHMGFSPGGDETVTATQQIFHLQLVENGKVLWEATGAGGAPHILQTKQGETAQAAADRQRQSSPFFFFSNAQLPARMVRYAGDGCFGTSELRP